MKHLCSRLRLVAILAAPAALVFASSLIGCGGSETATSGPEDAASDASTDAGSTPPTTDASDASTPPSDAGSEAAISPIDGASDATAEGVDGSDASSETDASDASDASKDSASANDGASDAGPTSADAASDATSAAADAESDGAGANDAGGDSTVGINDGGGDATSGEGGGGSASEAGSDAGNDAFSCNVTVPTLGNFLTDLASVVCQSVQACCGLTNAQFNQALCFSTYSNPAYGGWMNIGFVEPYFNGGGIAYSQTSACACLEGNATISCGLVNASTWDSLTSDCLGAVQGIQAIGDPCASSYECAPGGYCTVDDPSDPTEAGLGTCLALLSLGDACTSNQQCGYVGSGSPIAYCDTVTTNSCVITHSPGSSCTGGPTCSTDLCEYSSGTGLACASGAVFSDPLGSGGKCDYFTNPDSGAGGH